MQPSLPPESCCHLFEFLKHYTISDIETLALTREKHLEMFFLMTLQIGLKQKYVTRSLTERPFLSPSTAINRSINQKWGIKLGICTGNTYETPSGSGFKETMSLNRRFYSASENANRWFSLLLFCGSKEGQMFPNILKSFSNFRHNSMHVKKKYCS